VVVEGWREFKIHKPRQILSTFQLEHLPHPDDTFLRQGPTRLMLLGRHVWDKVVHRPAVESDGCSRRAWRHVPLRGCVGVHAIPWHRLLPGPARGRWRPNDAHRCGCRDELRRRARPGAGERRRRVLERPRRAPAFLLEAPDRVRASVSPRGRVCR